MYDADGLPKYSTRLENELQQELHCEGKINIINEIKPKYAIAYSHSVIRRVN